MFKLKALILFPLLVFFLLIPNPGAFAEDITITTYYPAPFGVYDQLITQTLGVGTDNPVYSLDVNGDIRAIGSVYYGGTVGSTNGAAYIKPDYVFEKEYKAMTIEEVEKYLKKENHLPWMTSVKKEREENGDVINMTRMTFEAVETAENLQLQMIKLNKTAKKQEVLIKEQQKRISILEQAIDKINK